MLERNRLKFDFIILKQPQTDKATERFQNDVTRVVFAGDSFSIAIASKKDFKKKKEKKMN